MDSRGQSRSKVPGERMMAAFGAYLNNKVIGRISAVIGRFHLILLECLGLQVAGQNRQVTDNNENSKGIEFQTMTDKGSALKQAP